jgi:aspartyl-tRNA(Asn)/glutamyl-tRNA(Gln) amidotransferase subunit A
MDEFALGGTGSFGAIRNPWNDSFSCDGAAAAVAAGEVPVAIGTDTGGCIRQSSSFCGITGIKPTYGSVSRFGITACGSSLEQAGPMGLDIEDCAALLSIISGSDEKDGTCIIDNPFDFNSGNDVKNLKIGLQKNLTNETDGDIKNAVFAAAKEFENAGANMEEFDMPLMDCFIPIHNIIEAAEVSSNLAKYDGLKYGYRSPNAKTLSDVYRMSRSEGFGQEVKRKIMLGSFVLSSGNYDIYFKKALQARTLVRDVYNKLFERFDFILSPAAACWSGEDLNNIYTASANLAGLPAIVLPCGLDRQGLPVGFQLIGNAFSEKKLIETARIYQKRTDFHTRTINGVGQTRGVS